MMKIVAVLNNPTSSVTAKDGNKPMMSLAEFGYQCDIAKIQTAGRGNSPYEGVFKVWTVHLANVKPVRCE